jgi:hypothetical protein
MNDKAHLEGFRTPHIDKLHVQGRSREKTSTQPLSNELLRGRPLPDSHHGHIRSHGPVAVFLVELFPTRFRYTSLSLPYHIGTGFFGGMLPLLATFRRAPDLVAATDCADRGMHRAAAPCGRRPDMIPLKPQLT